MNAALIENVHLAPQDPWSAEQIPDGAIAWRNGRIAWIGPRAERPNTFGDLPVIDGRGGWVTPGLIDCHTHLVYAGDRADEFEDRLEGVGYEEIARRGGGILSTVRHTRAATEDELVAQATPRLAQLLAEGVTTVEIKSGYGLDLETEAKMLRAARRLGWQAKISVSATFLGAHALPPEYAGRPDDYIRHVTDVMLPKLRAEGLVDAVDAFCERIGFTAAQTDRLFQAARAARLPVKLHAEQLSDQGGAELVAKHRGLSADHLEFLSEAGARAMAKAGTIAVLLPGAFYWLRETRLPPVGLLRELGVPIAVATDCNPGTSPLSSLLTAMNMACVLFRLTPREALAGTTRTAARALGLADRGILRAGLRADVALWRVKRPAELAYAIGGSPLEKVWVEGRLRG
jgi:imidazolonepropionase